MATQEERIVTLEQNATAFQKETVRRVREIQENATITLGLVQAEAIDIKRIYSRLDTLEQDVSEVKATQTEHTVLLHQHTALLTQILERLPKPL